MTAREDTARIQEAIRALPAVARRFATAVAADVEGDHVAVDDFAAWAAGDPVRVHALVVLGCVTAAAAGWGADTMRAYAATQEGINKRRPR